MISIFNQIEKFNSNLYNFKEGQWFNFVLHGKEYKCEVKGRNKDGSWIIVEREDKNGK